MAAKHFRYVEPTRAGIRLASSSSWVQQSVVGSPRVGRHEVPTRERAVGRRDRRAELSDGGRGVGRVERRRPSRGRAPGSCRFTGRRFARWSRGGQVAVTVSESRLAPPLRLRPARRPCVSRWHTCCRCWRFSCGMPPANERMQLTWLTGCPSRAASVHRLGVRRYGLGSAATQLMRAVSLLPQL